MRVNFVPFSPSGKKPSWGEGRQELCVETDGNRQSMFLTVVLLLSTVGPSELLSTGLGLGRGAQRYELKHFKNVMNRTKMPSEIRNHK